MDVRVGILCFEFYLNGTNVSKHVQNFLEEQETEQTGNNQNWRYIQGRGPFVLLATPVCWKKRKKIAGDRSETSQKFRISRNMRFSNSVTVPKIVKGRPFGIF